MDQVGIWCIMHQIIFIILIFLIIYSVEHLVTLEFVFTIVVDIFGKRALSLQKVFRFCLYEI